MRPGAVIVVVLAGFAGVALIGPGCAAGAAAGAGLALLAPLLAPWVGRIPWAVLTLGVLAALVSYGLRGGLGDGAPTAALGLLLVYLQVHGRVTRMGEDDDRKAVILAGLMLVTSAGLTQDPLFGAAVGAFGLALPAALSVGTLRPSAAIRLGLVAGLVGAGAFVIAPRANVAPLTVELTGFAPTVELGALDQLLDDPTEVFRAAIRPSRVGVVYWRGIALDTFDGVRWSAGSAPIRSTIQAPTSYPPDAYVIDVEPAESGVLFSTGWPLSVDADGASLRLDGDNGLSAEGEVRHYRIVAQGPTGPSDRAVTPPESDPAALQRALTLPANLDPRLAPLAARVAGAGAPLERARRVADWLRTSFTYTRTPNDRAEPAPLTAFLLTRRSGHCEYFASALAVLMRTQGVPARVVNGFVGGDIDPDTGWTHVRRYHAHSWVEVHDGGWWVIDPTPGPASLILPSALASPTVRERLQTAWDVGVVTYDRADQRRALVAAARAAEHLLPFTTSTGFPWRGIGLLALLLGVLVVGGRRVVARLAARWIDDRRPEPTGPVARAHHRARALVADRGWDVPRGLPPVAAAEWLVQRAPCDATEALLALAWLYYEVHLGRADPHAVAPAARRLLERVNGLPPSAITPAAPAGQAVQARK